METGFDLLGDFQDSSELQAQLMSHASTLGGDGQTQGSDQTAIEPIPKTRPVGFFRLWGEGVPEKQMKLFNDIWEILNDHSALKEGV